MGRPNPRAADQLEVKRVNGESASIDPAADADAIAAVGMTHGRSGLKSGCVIRSDRASEYTSTSSASK